METTKIKEKAIKIYEKLIIADKKDSASDSVKGMMHLAMSGKTTEEVLQLRNYLIQCMKERWLNDLKSQKEKHQ